MRALPIATLLLPAVGVAPAALPFADAEFAQLAAREAMNPELLEFTGGGTGLDILLLLVVGALVLGLFYGYD